MHFFTFLLVLSVSSFANSSLDQSLAHYMSIFKLEAMDEIKNTDKDLYEFGKMLFEDNILSLSNDISCKTCHDPSMGTSDDLPFSIGTGGKGLGKNRVQGHASITPRSAPHLYNKGHPYIKTMFWDGRVLYNSLNDTYETPEPGLNGETPLFFEIKETINSVIAMQALFPMTSVEEMRGKAYASLTNIEVWNEITKRVRASKKYSKYTTATNFNIGHIGNALGHFQKIEFQVTNTRWDKYARGDKSALTDIEKRGALVFNEKGRCSRCHNGPLLSNLAFQVVASPQVGPGQNSEKNDEGRYLVNGDKRFKYTFLTQPLRNIALTAPFMHDGSLVDLEEVIDHYDDPLTSLKNYTGNKLNRIFAKNYNSPFYIDTNIDRNNERMYFIAPMLRRTLGLTKTEKKELICFLKKSLTDINKLKDLDLSECLTR